MPLLKRKSFALVETPKDVEPHESVYQVRFTKEIFLDYRQYLNRINLYRQRVWTCKSTGKSNLTYEEALVSEKDAFEKVQALPNELVAPALRIIQFSMLSLKDLGDTIAKELQNFFFVGDELYGKKDGDLYSCRVLKVVEDAGKTKFEIGWLDRNREITEHSVLNQEDFVRTKSPFSRQILRSFIRESTCQSFPWLLRQRLAEKHGISFELPKELQIKFSFQNGQLVKIKKTNDGDDTGLEGVSESGRSKKLKTENGNSSSVQNGREELQPAGEPIKYPIDDLMVQPGPDDPVFTSRPIPSREFNIPMDCVADLLMVWDFCSSFGRLLHLSPFPLEDFENAICHKDSNVVLIVETNSALLRLLIKDGHEYLSALEKKKRKPKITLVTWTEYICDFLEMINLPELCSCITTIKRGHYGLLDVNDKLKILQELVIQVVGTDIFRDKLDEHIEQRNELGATRREEALKSSREKKEREMLRGNADVCNLGNGHAKENGESDLQMVVDENPSSEECGHVPEERNSNTVSSQQSNLLQDSGNSLTRKIQKQQDNGAGLLAEKAEDLSLGEATKLLKNGKRTEEKKTKEQRKEYFEREIEKRSLRSNPLGKDRDYNRYWWFRRDGRIFIETSDFKQWGYYSSKEELDALMGSLNCKGVRERALHNQLQKSYEKICFELQKRSKEEAHKVAMEEAVVRRSTRVRAPPRENPANAFLRYVNRWKED